MAKLRVGVLGCGRMGRLHARVYAQLPDVELTAVRDQDEGNAALAAEHGGKACADLAEFAERVDAATVAVPTSAHLEAAEFLLSRGVALLIEKPLARTSAECRAIVELSAKHGRPVMVGHIERFNPAVRAMQALAVRPGFIEVVRISPLTFRSIDVGVVLDVMIHDLDIVLRLAGSTVTDVQAVGVRVLGDAEDICNARLTFANGCVANLTASRLALKTERKLRVFSRDAYVSLDYQKKYGIVVRRGENLDAIRDAVRKLKSGELSDPGALDYAELVDVQELKIDDVEPLRAELEAFVAAARGERAPEVPAEDGLAAVELAERIVGAIPEGSI